MILNNKKYNKKKYDIRKQGQVEFKKGIWIQYIKKINI